MSDKDNGSKRRRGRPTKFDKILRELRSNILSGRFQPGDRLPTRETLASMYGSTKVTIQKAMDILLEEGMLSARRGAGTYVTGEADSKLPYFLLVSTPANVSRFKDALISEAKKRTSDKQALIVCRYEGPNYSSPEVERLLSLIARQRVAGMMFAMPYESRLKDSPLLDCEGIPKVFIGKDAFPGCTLIEQEGRAPLLSRVLDFYKERGVTKAAEILASEWNNFFLRNPFRSLAKERGIEVPEEWELLAPPRSPEAARRLVRLLMRNPADRPQALHIGDDNILPAVTETLARLPLRIPQDLLITAHANFPYPTTAHVPVRRIGYDVRNFIQQGLNALELIRKGEKAPSSVIPALWEDEVSVSI